MTIHATYSGRPSIIVPSGRCSVEWLCTVLPPVWFIGDYEPECHLLPLDCRPRLVDWWGDDRSGMGRTN